MCALGAVKYVCAKVLVVSVLGIMVIVVGAAPTATQYSATAPLSNCCTPAALRLHCLHDEALAFGRIFFSSSCVVLIEE